MIRFNQDFTDLFQFNGETIDVEFTVEEIPPVPCFATNPTEDIDDDFEPDPYAMIPSFSTR